MSTKKEDKQLSVGLIEGDRFDSIEALFLKINELRKQHGLEKLSKKEVYAAAIADFLLTKAKAIVGLGPDASFKEVMDKTARDIRDEHIIADLDKDIKLVLLQLDKETMKKVGAKK